MSYLEQQRRYIERVDKALRRHLSIEHIPKVLGEAMGYSVFAGGKRLRPCLCLAACELLKGDIKNALPFACALEMIHAYSLIHDDLPAMDDDDLRRGRLTNHKVFGEGRAILAGDGLLSYAFEIMLSTAQKSSKIHMLRAVSAASVVAKGCGVSGMVAGQSLDLLYEGVKLRVEERLYAIHSRKTGAMIKASVQAGALCANADAQSLCALEIFGEQYGLLFQITDDILDEIGDAQQLGKSIGKDKQAGKLTFPSVYGMEGAMQHAKEAADAARTALEVFGEDACFFYELIDQTLTRTA